jgi:hypothetical protein
MLTTKRSSASTPRARFDSTLLYSNAYFLEPKAVRGKCNIVRNRVHGPRLPRLVPFWAPEKKQITPPVVIALATPHRSRPKTSRTLGVLHDPPNLAYPCCVVHGSTPLKCNDNDDVETNSALAERRPALVTELRLECTSETLAVVELRFRVLQAASSARQSSGWPRYPGLFGLGRPDTRRERSHVLSTSTQVPTRTDLQNG